MTPNRTPLGASLAGLVLLISASARAEDCPPLAVVKGAGPNVASLTAALIARGVRVEPEGLPPGTCGALEVTLSEGTTVLSVAIRDPWGREAVREVRDPQTAAALVESWARMDLLDGVATSTRAVAKVGAAPTQAEPERKPITPVEAPAAIAATPVSAEPEVTPLFGVLAEAGIGRDRNRWLGASVAGCGHLGPACVGALGRYAVSQTRQNAVDAYLTLDTPLSLGIFTLSPGVGVGGGWMGQARSFARGGRAQGGRMARMGDGDRDDDRDGIGLRVEAHLAASIALIGGLRLEVGASASAAPELDRRPSLGDPGTTIVRGQAGLAWGVP